MFVEVGYVGYVGLDMMHPVGKVWGGKGDNDVRVNVMFEWILDMVYCDMWV